MKSNNCICLICKAQFHLKQSAINKGRGKYCSNKCRGISLQGKKPPYSFTSKTAKIYGFQKNNTINVGRVFTDEHKKNLSIYHYNQSGENNYWYGRKGENHSQWKGGKTPENIKMRMSVPYKNWRESVFERDNYTCQKCFKKGGTLNADHIKPFSQFPESRLDINNGITLCVECHKKTETFGIKAKRYKEQNT